MKYYLFACLHFMLVFLVLKSISCILPSTLPSSSAFTATLSLLVSYFTFGFTKKKFLNDVIDPSRKAIFITGCDTGFGHILAKRLDAKGYHVFAGCLFPDGPDAASLKESCSPRLKVLGIDVTKDESVGQAVEFVKRNLGLCDLWAIVNNAGIMKGFTVELSGLNQFQETMEVNTFGPVRVTKAFLPLLKQSRGRVVTVASIVARAVVPNQTPYVMSKHAAVAFSDCLRQELAEYGIQVFSIEPEMFKTNLTSSKSIDENTELTHNSSKPGIIDDKALRTVQKMCRAFLNMSCPKLELVIDDLEQAITSKYPDLIYKPMRNIITRFICQCYIGMPIKIRDLLIKIVGSTFKLIS